MATSTLIESQNKSSLSERASSASLRHQPWRQLGLGRRALLAAYTVVFLLTAAIIFRKQEAHA